MVTKHVLMGHLLVTREDHSLTVETLETQGEMMPGRMNINSTPNLRTKCAPGRKL